jgi:hypothetical protein
MTFCKHDVSDVLKQDVLKPDVLWVYLDFSHDLIIWWQCEDEHDWRVHGAAEEAAGGGGRQEEGPSHEERCPSQAPRLFYIFSFHKKCQHKIILLLFGNWQDVYVNVYDASGSRTMRLAR